MSVPPPSSGAADAGERDRIRGRRQHVRVAAQDPEPVVAGDVGAGRWYQTGRRSAARRRCRGEAVLEAGQVAQVDRVEVDLRRVRCSSGGAHPVRSSPHRSAAAAPGGPRRARYPARDDRAGLDHPTGVGARSAGDSSAGSAGRCGVRWVVPVARRLALGQADPVPDPLHPRGRPPVGVPGERHERRHQRQPDQGRVEDDSERQTQTEKLDERDSRDRERQERDGDEGGSRGHDPTGALQSDRDRLSVVAGAVVLLLDPRQQEHLVIHGEPEGDAEHEDRCRRVGQTGGGDAERACEVVLLEDPDHGAERGAQRQHVEHDRLEGDEQRPEHQERQDEGGNDMIATAQGSRSAMARWSRRTRRPTSDEAGAGGAAGCPTSRSPSAEMGHSETTPSRIAPGTRCGEIVGRLRPPM